MFGAFDPNKTTTAAANKDEPAQSRTASATAAGARNQEGDNAMGDMIGKKRKRG